MRSAPGHAHRLTALLLYLLTPLSLLASDRVSTRYGDVAGVEGNDRGVVVYRGVPYAAPPTGKRRWTAPQPPEAWDGILEADTWGSRCMQGDMFGGPLVTRDASMSEDCLYLNVWAPAERPDEALPVLFVLHGGGFAAGSAAEPRTDGEWFAKQGIIVVAPNYRLGVFGFFAHPELSAESGGRGSGNYGMLDIVAALEWTRDNIAAFGGNPDDITINGESAGSMAISALMVSPLSRDKFHKAIGQSGAYFDPPVDTDLLMDEAPLPARERDGLRLAESLGAESVDELRALEAGALLAAVMQQNGGWGYSPGIDGNFLTEKVARSFAAGRQADIPLLAGWTSAENAWPVVYDPDKPTTESFAVELDRTFGERAGDAAAVYPARNDAEAAQATVDILSDLFIAYSTWKWIETHGETAEAPVYRYRFDRTIPGDPQAIYGAVHASDIEYAFNTLDSKAADWRAEDRQVADTMAHAFANFILTGDPNGPGVPAWPEYRESGKLMVFDDDSRAVSQPHRARYEFLDSLDDS